MLIKKNPIPIKEIILNGFIPNFMKKLVYKIKKLQNRQKCIIWYRKCNYWQECKDWELSPQCPENDPKYQDKFRLSSKQGLN